MELEIDCPPSLLGDLAETVMAGFRQAAWGGPELGGVLFGAGEVGRVRIMGHRPIECEHARGPEFELSDRDRQGLARVLSEEAGGLAPAGWYLSKYREASFSASDAAVFDHFFPEPWQVTLVFGRDKARPCQVQVYSRRRNGTIESRRLELTPAAKREPEPEAKPEPEPEAKPEPEPRPEPPPPHRGLSWTPESREVFARLHRGVVGRKGVMVLTGEARAGKTTLLKCLSERLRRERVEFGLFLHSRMSVEQFYEMLAYDLALECPRISKTEVLPALNRLLLEQAELGRTTALLIDEAHDLGQEVLQEIQLLEGLRNRKERLLQIVLAGQPELERNLEAESLAGLRRQIVVRCRLEAVGEEARRAAAGQG